MACVLIVIGCAIGKLRVRYCRDRDRDVTALLETVTKIFFFFLQIAIQVERIEGQM